MNRLPTVMCGLATVMPFVRSAPPAFAQTPGTAFTYQGQLASGGQPANGPHDLRFQLWVSESDPIGPVVCKDNLVVNDGLFTAELDFGTNVFIGFPLWLEIEVRADATPGNGGSGSFTLLTPRQPLTPTPYAVYAAKAGLSPLLLPFNGDTPSVLGIDIQNMAVSAQPSYAGIFRIRNTASDSRAVSGLASAGSGTTYGVHGRSNSTAGIGVHGESFGLAGVHGIATNTVGENYGVYGRSDSFSGTGVFGRATSNNGQTYGVQGRTDSQNGYGVYGLATATTGNTFGVYGSVDSPDGTGVFGFSQESVGVSGRSVTGTGVLGTALDLESDSYGVAGQCVSTTGRGVYGVALNAGSNYGVFGEAYGIASYGVWSQGRFGASGTKSFRIDHPLDPENKYLNNYCTEAPEPLNAYSGTARLDGNGQVWVELPDYFTQINRNPRILLTAAGAPMPNLHASDEIVGNLLKIAGGAPAGKVYWRVEAARNDRWVQSYGAPEAVEKTAHERGKYQHPELYGQPPEMGMNYNAGREARLRETEERRPPETGVSDQPSPGPND